MSVEQPWRITTHRVFSTGPMLNRVLNTTASLSDRQNWIMRFSYTLR
jgi:hypothetical protein